MQRGGNSVCASSDVMCLAVNDAIALLSSLNINKVKHAESLYIVCVLKGLRLACTKII